MEMVEPEINEWFWKSSREPAKIILKRPGHSLPYIIALANGVEYPHSRLYYVRHCTDEESQAFEASYQAVRKMWKEEGSNCYRKLNNFG